MLPKDNRSIDNDDVNEANIANILDEYLSNKHLENYVSITTNIHQSEIALEIDEKIKMGLQLSTMGEINQPDVNFVDNLEAKLLQSHPRNTSIKTTENKTKEIKQELKPIIQFTRKLWLRKPVTIAATILLCLSGALAIPYFNSGKLYLSISDLLKPITGQKASAVTLAQLQQEYGLTITADAQEYDNITNNVVAIGNVTLNIPKSKLKAQADQIEWIRKTDQFILTGNVKIFHQGKIIKGENFSCFILENKCVPYKTEKIKSSNNI